jgi:uncharacterized protein
MATVATVTASQNVYLSLQNTQDSRGCCNPVSVRPPIQATEPLTLLVIQPTPFCNIDCSYCYLGDRANPTRMTVSTVNAVVRFLSQIPAQRRPLSVVWHAGEPLVVPASFYEEAFSCFTSGSTPIPVQHHFQTNATLINDEWCRFFRRFSVHIGVSIDGPKDIHDAHRVDRSGRGTFDKVRSGIEKLRDHKIPFTIISVITRAGLRRPAEIWEFLSSLGASQLAFNVEEAEGVHLQSSLDEDDLPTLARNFFACIAELQAVRPGFRVRELEDMRRHLTAPPGSAVMRANNRPGAILNIDVHGNVTTLSPELLGQSHPLYGKFVWANVHTDTWSDLTRNPNFLRAQQDVDAGIEKCRECGYFDICGGGNPSNKLAELGTFVGSETQHCRLHIQAVADVVLEQMEREQRSGRLSIAENADRPRWQTR